MAVTFIFRQKYEAYLETHNSMVMIYVKLSNPSVFNLEIAMISSNVKQVCLLLQEDMAVSNRYQEDMIVGDHTVCDRF